PQGVRDVLHGVWLGHPLHPLLTDLPIGAWSAAAVLDVVPGAGAGATTLVAAGCAAAVPTAVSGWVDWSDLHGPHQRVGANHAADIPDLFPGGWQDIGTVDELPDGAPAKRTVGGVDLLVVRRGQHVDVLSDKCSHLSGPLSDGEFTVEGGQGCVVCPWHGSTFRLADGAAVHGPATSPQNRFETKIENGRVLVSLNG